MRNLTGTLLIATLLIAVVLSAGPPAHSVDFRHLYTYGSKEGIHPLGVLNKKAARAVFGDADNPYGLVLPIGVTTDLHRRVWIPDRGTASVHVYGQAGASYREIRNAGGTAFRRPSGIASDRQGRVYLADAETGCIYVFDENGEFDHTMLKRERLIQSPGALAISDDSKSIYVADPPKNAVVELNREGEVNSTIQLPEELYSPIAISVVHNQIYVLGGQQHRIGIFSPGGRQRGELRWDDVASPAAFAFDAKRSLFLAVDPRWGLIRVFDEDGKGVSVFGQRGRGVDQMQRVDAIHVDSNGLVYIVDTPDGKVLVFGDAPQG